jgi:hypothetical protein
VIKTVVFLLFCKNFSTMDTSVETDKESVPVVSVRLVSADYYMSSPIPGLDFGYSTYRGLEIKKVPVIRIFGSTSTGT